MGLSVLGGGLSLLYCLVFSHFLSLALYFPNIRTNINSIILGSALGIVLGFIIIFQFF